MFRRLLTPLALLLLTLALPAQTVLEDFEGGADLTWNPFGDGTFDGVVENPAPNVVNMSMDVGSYTKSNMHAFSLLIGVLEDPIDLTTDNQLTIQIYSPVASQFIMKLEGDGEAIEQTQNIAVVNEWQEYTFDFSAAASFTTVTKIIIFFDPGVEESGDTYLYDNIVLHPAGPCAGTEVDPLVIDDFECQRNATYGQPGWMDVSVVANPDPSGINTSDSVGRYTDQAGGFHALVIDYHDALDLSVNNYVCIDVWAPVAGTLLFKLEGGVSAAFETDVQITETMTWVEACVDFSSQSAANHEKLVFFFNAGEDGDGDIYYIDNITRTPAPAAEPLEDFEGGPQLGWMPLNGDVELHGTFNGPISNPDVDGENTTPTVGSYTRGSSNFSTLTAILPEGIDLSGNPQINMQVWAPAGSMEVTLQLQSPTAGSISVTQDIPATEEWVTLNFNFEDNSSTTDFERINILFDPGTMMSGTYYFDNVGQGASTVDPCDGVEPVAGILDDFECQRNVMYGAGAERLTVIDNPDPTMTNPSLKVGEYLDPNDMWSALVVDYGDEEIDLSLNNQFSIMVWSPKLVPLLFKLEGGPNAPTEVFVDVTETEAWVRYQVDFSEAAGMGYTRLAIFFNAGQDPGGEDTYYIDNLEFRRAPIRDCVVNFETPEFTIADWQYFANGAFEMNPFIIQANPDPDAVNMSATVGTFEEANDGETFAGMFADTPGPIALPNDNKTMTMKVWMPVAGDVALKLERGIDGVPNSGDILATYDTPMEWQELTFDYSAIVPDDAQYERITIIPNFGVTPEDNLTHYFDDIAVAGASCNTVGLFDPVRVDRLRVMPNPATDWLRIENPQQARTFRIVNMLGQPVQTLRVAATELVEMDLTTLATGMYVLTAYDAAGQLVANATFVKE